MDVKDDTHISYLAYSTTKPTFNFSFPVSQPIHVSNERALNSMPTYDNYHKRSFTVCDWVEDIFKRSL